MSRKPKPIESLKQTRVKHRTRYKEYYHIGPIRAEGYLKCRGNITRKAVGKRIITTIDNYRLDDKDQPEFKGFCQAVGTADVFRVSAWINKDGSMRIEISENEGYKPLPKSNSVLPF